jgi:hypothetical protein
MLAYVFWHWPQTGVRTDSYLQDLRTFHRQLAAHRPAGFLSSAVFRIGRVPWLPENAVGYEDWYLVDGSGALDILNEAAVNPPLKESHDRAAHSAAGGTAGLYGLRQGSLDIEKAHHVFWFSKPEGVSYKALYDAMPTQSVAGLWGRQMTLGPTPEFCLRSESPVELPQNYDVVAMTLERLWP